MGEVVVFLEQSHIQIYTLNNNSLTPMNHYSKGRLLESKSQQPHQLQPPPPSQIENKPHRINLPARDYQDEQELCQPRQSDNYQMRELKSKMKILVGKLATAKKEREAMAKQNEGLQVEVLNLQNNLRHMVAGFNNTTSDFPMNNELAAKVAQFYKYDCLDKFFDLLGPEELTLKGIIYFYLQTFQLASALVDAHFQPAFLAIKQVGCLDSLEGPVMNVLRKAFQTKHQHIVSQVKQSSVMEKQAAAIIDALGIGCTEREEAVEQITAFLAKLVQIILECKISDPPLLMQVGSIGKRIEYNPLSQDPFDGFIKQKEECFVILPEVRKRDTGEQVTKALVLHKNYDLNN